MRSTEDLALMVGMSAKHMALLEEGEARPGPVQSKWIRSRLSKEDVDRVIRPYRKEGAAKTIVEHSMGTAKGVPEGRMLIPSVPAESIMAGDWILFAAYDTLHWVEVTGVEAQDVSVLVWLSFSDEPCELRKQDIMRVARYDKL